MQVKNYDAIVIGGSAAGIAAAITVRRHYPESNILIIRKNEEVPIPCGIPYTFGLVSDPKMNLLPIDALMKKNTIGTIVDSVVNIDCAKQLVITKHRSEIIYDKLIIATGSEPVVPPIQGSNLENIFSIHKDVPYLENVINKLKTSKSLCIVGGGFIGVELAEECRRNRPELKIHVVEMMNHCLKLVYDEDLCVCAEDILKKQNISLYLSEKVEAFNGDRFIKEIVLGSGKKIDSDIVILGIGAIPNVELAKTASLELGPKGAIKVNRYMQTSDRNIFACGDCAEKVSFFDGNPSTLKLASIATMEARIAGANLFHKTRINPGVMGVFSTVLGDTAFASAGLTFEQAKEKGFDVVASEAESVNRHPGCMPEAKTMKVKLLFEIASGVLLGGQIVGAKSGGELINAISACINQRMTADDLATFQTGTHPALTASPIAYQLVNAAEEAIKNIKINKLKNDQH